MSTKTYTCPTCGFESNEPGMCPDCDMQMDEMCKTCGNSQPECACDLEEENEKDK